MKITIIGCGNMGKAFALRLSPHHSLFLIDHNPEKAVALQALGYGNACSKEDIGLIDSDYIIIAVKPQSLDSIVDLIHLHSPKCKIISLLTGTTLSTLKQKFPLHTIIRMMPNLAITYGDGLVGLVSDESLLDIDKKQIVEICHLLGRSYWIKEDKINAFTALAGSGPAFILTIIESIVESGISMGFSANLAKELTAQMIKGTISLLEHSDRHPADLKWQITSPNGTTIAGIKQLELSGVRGGVMNGFLAAYERANELSN